MGFPVSHYVYSSLAYFGTARGGELPGRWFVEALAVVGCDEDAVRQTLYRMEHSGELTSRREGRVKYYAPSGYASGEISAGTEKIFGAPEPWDGRWTLVHARFEQGERIHRDRLLELLAMEGFATVAPGLHVHPRPLGERILAAIDATVRQRVFVIRGERIGGGPESQFISRHWDIPALALRYRKAIEGLEWLGKDVSSCTDVEAFRRRFEVVMRFLSVASDDPNLPSRLLPDDWPGAKARELAAALYTRFLPGAIRFGDSVLERIGQAHLVGGAT